MSFREETHRLEEQLRDRARAIPVQSSDALHRRIMAGLASETVIPARHPGRPLFATALAAGLAAAAVGLWLNRPQPVESRMTETPHPSLPDTGALVLAFPSDLVGHVGSPLDRETAALQSDLLSASQYLLELTGI
jgi:hypothetical protein